MSWRILESCWPMQMPPTAKSVLISLADQADDQGHCFPSLDFIMARTCFGRTAVIEAIKCLEELGVVRADRSNRYKTTYVVTPGSFTGVVRQMNQSGRRTSSDGGALVRQADDEVRQPDDEVRQTDTNHQEPPITVNKSNRQSSRTNKFASKRFADFWQAYPRKAGSKKRAEKSWVDQNLDLMADQLIDNVKQRAAEDARWSDPQYIPHAVTYLNNQRWNDEWTRTQRRPSVTDHFSTKTYQGSTDEELPDWARSPV